METESEWYDRKPMPTRRHDHASYVSEDGVVVISGFDDATNFSETIFYEPDDDAWDETRAAIPTARGLFGSCRIDDDIYVVAGKRLRPGYVKTGEAPQYDVFDAVERYDVDADEWTVLSPAPTVRAGLDAAAVGGSLYAVGGMVCEDSRSFPDPSFVTDLVEVYDPATDSWSTGPSLPEPRMGPTVECVGDRVFVVGGSYDGTVRDEVFVFDPGSGIWSTAASLTVPRRDAASVVHDGRLFVFCGVTNGDDRSRFTGSVEVYDPELDQWRRCQGLPTEKAWAAAAAIGETAYVTGGARWIADEDYEFLNEVHKWRLPTT